MRKSQALRRQEEPSCRGEGSAQFWGALGGWGTTGGQGRGRWGLTGPLLGLAFGIVKQGERRDLSQALERSPRLRCYKEPGSGVCSQEGKPGAGHEGEGAVAVPGVMGLIPARGLWSPETADGPDGLEIPGRRAGGMRTNRGELLSLPFQQLGGSGSGRWVIY